MPVAYPRVDIAILNPKKPGFWPKILFRIAIMVLGRQKYLHQDCPVEQTSCLFGI